MKVLLINEKKLDSFKLPNKIDGNIWITDFDENDNEKNIINIEADRNSNWKIMSNSSYYIVENSKRVASSILEIGKFYIIKDSYSDKSMLLYCCLSYENNITFYSTSTCFPNPITIGSNSECKISYNCTLVSNNHAEIKLENDKLILNCFSKTYVNNIRVNNSTILELGDVIFVMGLIIVVMKIQGDYILGINNPNNQVKTFLKNTQISFDPASESYEEAHEEKEMFLYKEEDYFYKKPRFIYSIEPLELKIDSPPSKQEKQEIPAILTLGPMLTMSLTSVVTCYTTISNVQNKNQTWSEAIPSLLISGVMMLSFFLWPLVTNLFQKHLSKKNERNRQNKYNEYINNQKSKIFEEKTKQENILHKRYVSLEECYNIIINKKDRLWERRIEDEDYLSVSLGTGTFPMKININYPEEGFSMVEDNLKDSVKELTLSPKILDNVPILYSFKENYISAIIGNDELKYKFIDNILLQIVTFHSYDDLKIVIFTSKNKENNFTKYKILPHCFSNDKTIRFFSSTIDEYKEISYNLEKIFNQRKEYNEKNSNLIKYDQNFLIITDSFNSIRNFDFIKNIIEYKHNLGFSIIILNDKISNLPDQCQTFIELNENESKMFKNIANNGEQKFKIDLSNINISKAFRKLANIPIELNNNEDGIIPKKVGFLEMYDVGKVEQLNSKNRWISNVPILNMSAIVGIGKSGEKISLDLHEKYHGPHGLVAGMTGSGKSEFIITYILSMAINYHPHEVQFVLIDYKGGGLAGAFENKNLGYKLPHLVGVITNLDKTEINRSLASIESELKRRQALFNKARELSGESTIDIYKYQKMYRNKIVDEPVSHLFIIADEFAELKTQQSEFMEQLISTARIGRSLGVHLILATQKPSGVVDSQIWSNTRFRVCFRVQEKSDSSEVIQCPDAAYLTQTGRFYLQVGYNEIFLLGQSAWAGGKYIPSENIKKTIDSSINFIDNIGYVTKSVETKKEEIIDDSNGEELVNIVKYLHKCAIEENIFSKPLWLDRIPEHIYVNDLIKKYNYEKEKYILEPVIGEYDIPNMQQQNLLTIPFSKEGNVIIYGMAGSGKENFITTMIYSSMITYTPEEVNYYILDFGSEVLKYFEKTPIVGDILYINDSEKISNLFKFIQDTINERKKIFADYNGDYEMYCKSTGITIPHIVIIINNYEAYAETYPDYDDLINILTRDCIKYGIYFVFTINSPNGIRFKLKQNFNQIFVLQQNNEDDYSSILGNIHKTYPSKMFGRGLIKKEDVYEFQTALTSEESNVSKIINQINTLLSSKYNSKATKIPVLPEVVIYDELDKNKVSKNEIIIGINKNDLTISTFDFSKNHINLISSQEFSLFESFINPFITQFMYNQNWMNIIINAEDVFIEDIIKQNSKYFESNFDSIFDSIINILNNSYISYKNNNYNKSIFDNIKKINCIIIGLNSFKNKLSAEKQNAFGDLFTISNDLGIINYIFIETIDKMKNFEYEAWYKNNRSQSDCIWLGNGLGDQFSINLTQKIPEMAMDVQYNFCFVIKRGKPSYVKYIEKINNN